MGCNLWNHKSQSSVQTLGYLLQMFRQYRKSHTERLVLRSEVTALTVLGHVV